MEPAVLPERARATGSVAERADLWPDAATLYRALAERVSSLLVADDLVAEVARIALGRGGHVLSARPLAPAPFVVVGACVSAGGRWRQALWPAAGMECLMAAADLLDDVADGELAAYQPRFGAGVVLTCAAGLLQLASAAVLRAVEDGVAAETALALGRVFGAEFARAADGQARSLDPSSVQDVLQAYQAAARKSGPLGALAGRLGARIATDDPALLDQYAAYGWHLAVHSQLLNDARDAAPDGSREKRDVRSGARTVPLLFAGSTGAPPDLEGAALAAWETVERQRLAAQGGIAVTCALAEAERLKAMAALDALARSGHPVQGLRALLH